MIKKTALVLFVCCLATASAFGAEGAAAGCCASWKTLFNGQDLTGWTNARPGQAIKWVVEDGAMTNTPKDKDIATTEKFQDFDLKLEYKTVPKGNSGVYLRGRTELQVLDSHGKTEISTGDDGGIYGQHAPLVNASKPAGQWNTLEATFVGDTLTAKLNGKLIHDKVKITDVTGGALPGGVTDPGPLMLQGDHGKVWYRNIQIRPINAAAECPTEKSPTEQK